MAPDSSCLNTHLCSQYNNITSGGWKETELLKRRIKWGTIAVIANDKLFTVSLWLLPSRIWSFSMNNLSYCMLGCALICCAVKASLWTTGSLEELRADTLRTRLVLTKSRWKLRNASASLGTIYTYFNAAMKRFGYSWKYEILVEDILENSSWQKMSR